MKLKYFIRFVVNDNGSGKIKAMNKIVKLYEDNGDFIKIQPPYIYATGTQIDVDIEEIDSNKYLPLRHFKHKDGKIIKKTNAEIEKVEQTYRENKEKRLEEIEQKQKQVQKSKDIITNKNKSDKEKIEALSELIKQGAIK